MTNIFKKWMIKATPAQRVKLAVLAKTSLGNLNQIAGAYRTEGRVSTTPELARRIELASVKLSAEGLPILKREELCAACGRCEYAKNKKG